MYRRLGILTTLCLALTSIAAHAQTWPSRGVRIVVPFPPGGATDIIARLVAEQMTRDWSQPVVVENRAGAGGTIGTDLVAKAQPDGYTLLLATLATNAIAPAVYPKLPYDPVRDFTPITPLAGTVSAIAINPAIPVQTLAEFIAYARARPGQLAFSSPGAGVSAHLAMEHFAQVAGLKMIHVPYKGSAPALNAVVAGEVAATFDPIASLAPLAKAGRVRALAISGRERSALLPDVPTIAEAGVRGVESYTWNGLAGPAGLPAAIVDRIHADVSRMLRSDSLRQRLASMGSDALLMSPKEFADFVASETTKWGDIARATGASQ
jgi:tripartite-type tricarboxylate transporter receptor subunit TctC